MARSSDLLDMVRGIRLATARGSASLCAAVVTPGRWVRFAAGRPWAAVQAVRDAGRAWAATPTYSGRSVYVDRPDGSRKLRSFRPYRLDELLKLKFQSAHWVFLYSARLGIADSVVILRFRTEGLLANLLHVLESLHRTRPGARVHVDWVLQGNEVGFRYGNVGDDLWTALFRPLGPYPQGAPLRASLPIDFAFWGTGKDHLTGWRLRRHRKAYHVTLSKWLEVTNPRILQQVREISARSLEGRFCVAVHRRVPNTQVANLQAGGQVPSLNDFIGTAEAILAKRNAPDWAVFLATDDAGAIDAFRRAFGARLVVRDNVQRTTATAEEVHFRAWDRLSLADAEDVLIDTILLSRCDVLIHASSSVSTVAALMNPVLSLVRASASG